MFRQFSNAQAIKLFVSLWKISTPELTVFSIPLEIVVWALQLCIRRGLLWYYLVNCIDFFSFFSVSVIRLQFPSADGNYVGFKPKRSSGPPAKKRKWVVFVLFIFCFRNWCRNPGSTTCPLLCVPLLCVPTALRATALRASALRAHCSACPLLFFWPIQVTFPNLPLLCSSLDPHGKCNSCSGPSNKEQKW